MLTTDVLETGVVMAVVVNCVDVVTGTVKLMKNRIVTGTFKNSIFWWYVGISLRLPQNLYELYFGAETWIKDMNM